MMHFLKIILEVGGGIALLVLLIIAALVFLIATDKGNPFQ